MKWLMLACVAVLGACSAAPMHELPSGGTTSWEIEQLEAIVTFLIFDPNDPAIERPAGLRFTLAREMDFPELQEHLKHHPEHSDWAFSFVEFVRPKTFVIDGRAPDFPGHGGIGVWFAPVDHSHLAAEISEDTYQTVISPSPDAVIVFGLWIPDREYVAYMRARGHHAEYGMVTVVQDSTGAIHGELKVGELIVQANASPRGEVRHEPDPFTQVFFEPGRTVRNVVIIRGENARERDCSAEWSKAGDHPLANGVFVGPTFQVIEGPIIGSAYRVYEE